MSKNWLWVDKYRPHRIADCILPDDLKHTFTQFVEQKTVPDMLLVGKPGVGKTTVAKALLEELDTDYLVVPATLKGNVDTLRNEIFSFASSVSFKGGKKYVILDEADYLTHATQPNLRNFMDMFQKNCGFILTANYQNKIIEPIQSRCPPIEFKIRKDDAPKLAKAFFNRVKDILKEEGVEYDKSTITAIILKHYPDWRRVLRELQRYAISGNGKIDSGILSSQFHTIRELVTFLKNKDFTGTRRWITENLNNDAQVIFRQFYDEATEHFTPQYIPELVLILAKYQYQNSFVVDQEINFAAAMTEIMVTAAWK